jgi:hypothetical protein
VTTKHHTIADPYAETIGLSSLTIKIPEDFRGDVEICWWIHGKTSDEDKQILTCSATALLQGLFRHIRGASRPNVLFDARVVALVLHAFYRARIEAAAQLEAAYTWQPFATADLSPPRTDLDLAVTEAKRGLGAVMEAAWTARQEEALSVDDYNRATFAASRLRQAFEKLGSK